MKPRRQLQAMLATLWAAGLLSTGCWDSPRACEDAATDCFGDEVCRGGTCVLASALLPGSSTSGTTPPANNSSANNSSHNSSTLPTQSSPNQLPCTNSNTPQTCPPVTSTCPAPNNQTSPPATHASLAEIPRLAISSALKAQATWMQLDSELWVQATSSSPIRFDPGERAAQASFPVLLYANNAAPADQDGTMDSSRFAGIKVFPVLCFSEQPFTPSRNAGSASLLSACGLDAQVLAGAGSLSVSLSSAFDNVNYCTTAMCDYDCDDMRSGLIPSRDLSSFPLTTPRHVSVLMLAHYDGSGSLSPSEVLPTLDSITGHLTAMQLQASLSWRDAQQVQRSLSLRLPITR